MLKINKNSCHAIQNYLLDGTLDIICDIKDYLLLTSYLSIHLKEGFQISKE